MSDLREALQNLCDANMSYSLVSDAKNARRLEQAKRDADAALAQPEAVEPMDDGALLKAMEQECWTLQCVDIPTGGGDADVRWEVIQHYQTEPHDRMIAHGRTPMEALRNALAPKCPNCNDANEYGDYEGPTCEVCGGAGRALAQPEAVEPGGTDDPTSDERWNAGLDFAMMQLCAVMRVDPHDVTWDAATEEAAGDVRAVIWNILRAKMGEDWKPEAPPLAHDERMRRALVEARRLCDENMGPSRSSLLNKIAHVIDEALSRADEGKESRAKATEGKAGNAGGQAPVRSTTTGTGLRVGAADAVQPATSEIMDATAGRDRQPLPSDDLGLPLERLKTDAARLGYVLVPNDRALWPNGCHAPNSCSRHRACMYTTCKHNQRDISGEVDLARAGG